MDSLNQGIYCLSALGSKVGDSYRAHTNCLDVLKDVYLQLLSEDQVTRSVRRKIHLSRGLENDIIPLLLETKDNNILALIMKILASLLVPVECLLSLDNASKTKNGQIILFELNTFLNNSKITFRDPCITSSILQYIKSLMQSIGNKPDKDACEAINDGLLLLRNILHIPDSQKNVHNIILWNLFEQNIDQILLFLMTHKYKEYWSVATVQVVAVLFKDQHVGTLQKLLHISFECSMSESSEDNESNTTHDPRSISSNLITSSEPTSDSSEEIGKGRKDEQQLPQLLSANAIHLHHRSRKSSGEHSTRRHKFMRSETLIEFEKMPQELSDYGYSSHLEVLDIGSTSSNEDDSSPPKRPFHLMPHIQKTKYSSKQPSANEKTEAKRKKLMKRRKNTIGNKKALTNHNPRDEDITQLLAEFTVDFLSSGYEPLVSALLSELSTTSNGLSLDTSHFFWLLTYFLKFIGQLELDIEQIRGILSFRVLSYLVYAGMTSCEQLEESTRCDSESKSLLRRLHLVVTAIREFILSLEMYSKATYLSLEDRQELRQLNCRLGSCCDLKNLFVLMIRLYDQGFHSEQYLEDLVVTNHILLIFLEHHTDSSNKRESLAEHLKKFATLEIMKNYGRLLHNFQSNGEFVNDCVFTMMHHIGGEMNQVSCLFQADILKTFTLIYEFNVQLCEDWSDLIEYVINRFVTSSSKKPSQPPETSKSNYLLNHLDSPPISKDPADFIQFYDDQKFLQNKSSHVKKTFDAADGGSFELEPEKVASSLACIADIGLLSQLLWVKRLLLDVGSAKEKLSQLNGSHNELDPVLYFCCISGQDVPLVPWSCDLAVAFENVTFQSFLLSLGFQQSAGQLFFRIPSSWSSDKLFSIARKIGPIDSELSSLAGDVCSGRCLSTATSSIKIPVLPFAMPCAKNATSMVSQTPLPNLPKSWLDVVMKSKVTAINYSDAESKGTGVNKLKNASGEHSAMECAIDTPKKKIKLEPCSTPFKVCTEEREVDDIECASVVSLCNTQASDVTRMCVSDEGEDESIHADAWH